MDASGARSKGIARSLRKLGVMVSALQTLSLYNYASRLDSFLSPKFSYKQFLVILFYIVWMTETVPCSRWISSLDEEWSPS